MNWFIKLFRKNNSRKTELIDDKISFEFERYDQTNADAYVSLLCEGYRLKGNFTLNEIANFVRNNRTKHKDYILLATLDDVWQAAYTSGHAIDKHQLNDISGYDLSNLPSNVFEEIDGKVEHNGHLTLTQEFPIRHRNFMAKASVPTIGDLKGKLWWGESENSEPIMTDDDVYALEREKVCFVQFVPVQSAPEALAAYPNGYFSDDLNPFQNYAISKHLNESFGLELFGVGATYLGFMREEVLTENEAARIGELLELLFDGYDGEESLRNIICRKLVNKKEFYLAYGPR